MRLLLKTIPIRLGQAQASQVHVVVTDANGKPVPEAELVFSSGGRQVTGGIADAHGHFYASLDPASYQVRVDTNGLIAFKDVSRDEVLSGQTVFVQLPVAVPDRILKPVDAVILGSAIALFAVGSHWNIQPMKLAGEITFGAAVFGLIYRISTCL